MNKLLYALYLFGIQFLLTGQFDGMRNAPAPASTSLFSRTADSPIFSDSLAWKVGDTGIIQGSNIAVDDRGNVYVGGSYRDTVRFSERTFVSKGESDLFLAKYSPDGVLQWIKTAGGTETDGPTDICTDADGNVYLTGYLRGKVQFESEVLEAKGITDIFFAKYDTDGNLQWIRQIGGEGSDGGSGVAVNKNGDVYLSGDFSSSVSFDGTVLVAEGPEDAFIALYDSGGQLKWVRSGGGVGHDWGQSLAVDKEGNALMLGRFHQLARFGKVELRAPESEDLHSSNGFILKCSLTGEFIWGQRMGGNRRNIMSSVVVNDRGDVFVSGSGYMKGSHPTFGDSLIHSDEVFGAIIAKLSSDGVVQWVMSTIATVPYQRSLCVDTKGNLVAHTSFDNAKPLKVSGRTTSQFFDSKGVADFVIAKFASDGSLLNVRQEGGAGQESVNAMVISKNGTLYILGSFDSPVTLAGTALRNQGNRNAFVMKIPAP